MSNGAHEPDSNGSLRNDMVLLQDAFLRVRSVAKTMPASLLLGAGASITSGVPSAAQCIWMWKREIVVSNDSTLAGPLSDVSRDEVRDRIQSWLDRRGGYPPRDNASEYEFYAEKCYPSPSARRQFFTRLARDVKPHVGYRLLALLAEAGIFNGIWTTNFDGLAARAIAARGQLGAFEVGLDSGHRGGRPTQPGEVMCAALHGDYRYDALKNTAPELREQDTELCQELAHRLHQQDLVVLGYSGRDASLMQALTAAYAHGGAGRLFWLGYLEAQPPDHVRELLEAASEAGREAFYVPASDFDDVMRALASQCLEGALLDQATALGRQLDAPPAPPAPFSLGEVTPTRFLRSNAHRVRLPQWVYQFDAPEAHEPGAWSWLREKIAGTDIVAAIHRGTVLAIACPAAIRAVFGPGAAASLHRATVGEGSIRPHFGEIQSLLREAIMRSLAGSRELSTDGRRRIWVPRPTWARLGEQRYAVHDAVEVQLRTQRTDVLMVLHPTLEVLDAEGEPAPLGAKMEIVRRTLGRQWNTPYHEATNAWAKRLLATPGRPIRATWPLDGQDVVQFEIERHQLRAAVSSRACRTPLQLTEDQRALVPSFGIEYPEPLLRFSNRQADRVIKDAHPIRGLLNNRPFDHALTVAGLTGPVRVAVVCSRDDGKRVRRFLSALREPIEPDSKDPYLLRYPGFTEAFGVGLTLGTEDLDGWCESPEPDPGGGLKAGRALYDELARSLDHAASSWSPDVVIVYVPERWLPCTKVEDTDATFDLHDQIKAFGAERGIATQFLQEATLTKAHPCEIRWWLALALYAKARRTPWLLDDVDPDTAYVGIGFSHAPKAQRGRHIVIGCSHIFTPGGDGLRYQLRRVDNPVWSRGNPYLSRDDAYRVGDDVRQLFYSALGCLPRRVVIHKRTEFRRDERDGLLDGLRDVEAVEMLELREEPTLRYTAMVSNSKPDSWPVSRGTAVLVDDRQFLLWVHGVSSAVHQYKRYYQGKSRIPGPLSVIRHHGRGDLSTLATEILGLAKMDWNNMDLYSQQPITVRSANAIAQIGTLLRRLGPSPYDYRLLM